MIDYWPECEVRITDGLLVLVGSDLSTFFDEGFFCSEVDESSA